MIRAPLVAGQFYPAGPAALKAAVEKYMAIAGAEKRALLAIVPHAGYIYSGAVAGQVFGQVKVPRQVLLLGPNHSGRGASAALASYSAWQTPLGMVPASDTLNQLLLDNSSIITLDNQAHQREHSLEVELPFLQVKQPELRVSALSLGRLDWPRLQSMALSISQAISQCPEPVLIVASTDMNHYLSAGQTEKLDTMAIERITSLDPAGLYQVVRKHGITMCGVLAVVLGLQAALLLGASWAELTGYRHSGMVSGDNQQVVGYAGALVGA